MKRAFSILVILVITSSLLTGCQADHSYIFSDECQAPCWRQITPGMTNYEDTMSIVMEFSDIDTKSISEWDTWYIFDKAIDFNLNSGEQISIGFINNAVVWIGITNENGIISFEKAIEIFQEPESVAASQILGSGSRLIFFVPTDAYHTVFNAIYLSRGIAYNCDLYDDWKPVNNILSPETRIYRISLFDALYYQELLKSPLLISQKNSKTPLLEYEWKGYGDVSTIYPFKGYSN